MLTTAAPGHGPTRRTALAAGAVAGASVLLATDVRTAHGAVLRTDPFALGVASGDPLPTSVVLWTRLVGDRTLAARDVTVAWEVAADARFTRRVASGTAVARPAFGHSVHVDARGLEPGRWYWYRFRAEGHVSPAGRTRTAPAPTAAVAGLRLVVASCQDYQNGYWPALWGVADEDVDVVLHLGDYIYEYDPASILPDRRHTTPRTPGRDQLTTLADYQARHAQYKRDPALQAAHARAPWVVTWDDHDVENNYAGLVDEVDDEGAARQTRAAFARQRAAAYQAYWEHMPLRARVVPGSADLRIFRHFDFGRLLRLNVLDTRQYRTDQPGGRSDDVGAPWLGDGNRSGTLTGADQDAWLARRLETSSATWNVLAQQVIFGAVRLPNYGADLSLALANLDAWDGYAPQRRRWLRYLADRGVANPVVLSGDFHSTWVNDLPLDPQDPWARPVATEFVTPSISSQFAAPSLTVPLVEAVNATANPHTRYFQAYLHGYVRMHVTPQRWLVEERLVPTVLLRRTPVTTRARFVVEAGRPGAVRA